MAGRIQGRQKRHGKCRMRMRGNDEPKSKHAIDPDRHGEREEKSRGSVETFTFSIKSANDDDAQQTRVTRDDRTMKNRKIGLSGSTETIPYIEAIND